MLKAKQKKETDALLILRSFCFPSKLLKVMVIDESKDTFSLQTLTPKDVVIRTLLQRCDNAVNSARYV